MTRRWIVLFATAAFLPSLARPSDASATLVRVSHAAKGSCPTRGATTPQLAVDPRDPQREVATWEVGQGTAALVGRSSDGGRTWTSDLLSGITPCSGGPDGLVVDPYLAIGPDGQFVATSSWVNPSTSKPALGNDVSRVYVSRSAQQAAVDVDSSQADQRAPVVIESHNPSHVLISVERIVAAQPTPTGGFVPFVGSNVAVLRSTDGGRNFAAPVLVEDPGPGVSALTAGLAQSARGIVAVAEEVPVTATPAIASNAPVTGKLYAFRSTDDGRHFGARTLLGTFTSAVDGSSPAGCCIPDTAAGAGGDVAVVWPDALSPAIHLAMSRDGGASWTSRVVAHAPHGALMPAVALLPDGRAAVAYDDRWSSYAQPYLAITAGVGHPASNRPLASRFDVTAITDGNADPGVLGPEQDIAAVPGGVRVLLTLAGQRDEPKGDVEVYQADVPVASLEPATASLPRTGSSSGWAAVALLLLGPVLLARRPKRSQERLSLP